MGHAALRLPMSASEFLSWDQAQTVKHEYLRGDLVAMAGAGKAHVALTLNVAMALRQHLRGTACSTFMTDIKLRVESANVFFYPDVQVTCSAADAADPAVVREPTLVVEVLSPATASFDRGEKFAIYRELPSLREYVLIDPASRRCEVFRKAAPDTGAAAGEWSVHPVDAGGDLFFSSVDLNLPAAQLWDAVPAAQS